MIRVVSATRWAAPAFWRRSALGLSLSRLSNEKRIRSSIAYENRSGLSSVYNRSIPHGDENDILVFIHDDVWIDDYFIASRLIEGLKQLDILGLAGSIIRKPWQDCWFLPDRESWSGAVAHGVGPFGEISFFGEFSNEVELIDGVMIAAKRRTLIESGLRFDPTFEFHFYDLDFSRSARSKKLRVGTWPIAITHQSGGAFGSAAWNQSRSLYFKKWEEDLETPSFS